MRKEDEYYLRTGILIATRNNQPCLLSCLIHLEELDPQPTYYIICENNSEDLTINTLETWKEKHTNTILIRLWFKDNAEKEYDTVYDGVAIAREFLLKKARQLDLDYVIFIDDDIFVQQKDLITRFISDNKDIVGGPYSRYFFGENPYVATEWFNENPNESKMFPFLLKTNYQPILEKVAMTSAGCMGLGKKIIQDDRLHFYPVNKKQNASEDFGFCLEANDLGYSTWLDGTVKIHHVIYQGFKDKREWYSASEPRAR